MTGTSAALTAAREADAVAARTVKTLQADGQLPLGQLRIPHFPVPEGETVESWLTKECRRGLAWRYIAAPARGPAPTR